MNDGDCARWADALGITVIALQYRLAPQHPYPTPLDDCVKGWHAVLEHADELGIDPTQVAIGGASAGGGLAASLALRIHDAGAFSPSANCWSTPCATTARARARTSAPRRHLGWSNLSNKTGWGAYLGKQRGQDGVADYAAAARREDLSGLPPAWVGVGTLDLFHDEDVEYARRLKAAGVPTTLDVVEGAYHGFEVMDANAEVSKAFDKSKLEFLRSVFAGAYATTEPAETQAQLPT